jgi:hypothetical protein
MFWFLFLYPDSDLHLVTRLYVYFLRIKCIVFIIYGIQMYPFLCPGIMKYQLMSFHNLQCPLFYNDTVCKMCHCKKQVHKWMNYRSEIYMDTFSDCYASSEDPSLD